MLNTTSLSSSKHKNYHTCSFEKKILNNSVTSQFWVLPNYIPLVVSNFSISLWYCWQTLCLWIIISLSVMPLDFKPWINTTYLQQNFVSKYQLKNEFCWQTASKSFQSRIFQWSISINHKNNPQIHFKYRIKASTLLYHWKYIVNNQQKHMHCLQITN